MGRLSGRTLIHFKDGSTLTDKELWPHNIENLDEVTSVERVVKGWHLSILKSPVIRGFFIITEARQNLSLGTGLHAPRKIISARTIGCYLKDSDPPVKCMLSMDPRTKCIEFEVQRVNKFRPDGLSKHIDALPRGVLKKKVGKEMGEGLTWTIINEAPIRRVFGTENGLGCLIGIRSGLRVIAELKRTGLNCQLLIMPEN